MTKRWYIVHAYSNFEKNVAKDIKKRAEAAGLAELFEEVLVPMEEVVEVRQEVSKVTWPAWKEVWITTAMVLVMVALTSVFFLFADMVISHVVQFVLRLGR